MKGRDVIIIGAGMAGLAAANYLKENGFNVTIFEARSYVGGRISIDHSFGIPMSCGAAYLHGTEGNPIYSLLNQYKCPLVKIDGSPLLVFNSNGKRVLHNEIEEKSKLFEEFLIASKKYVSIHHEDISLLSALEECIGNYSNKKFTLSNFSWDLLYLSMFTGIEANHLSGREWDQGKEFTGGTHLILSYYESVITNLSINLNIQLETIVKKINYKDKNVVVESNKGAYTADAVIVTVPLGVLQSDLIQFTPPLPSSKIQAINGLQMSLLNKVMLLFPFKFWPDEFSRFGYDCDTSRRIGYFINYSYFFKKPILLGAMAGKNAANLENEGHEVVIQCAIESLKDLFGNNIPAPISTVVTNWNSDIFSRGAYTTIPVGSNGTYLDELAASINDKLFFAGEATSRDYHVTVHGAYLSGIREAQKIVNLTNHIP